MPKNKVKINVKERLEDNVLDLSLSEIEDIPVKEIAALRRATVLDLSSNNIKFIPKNFGTQLSNFYRIDLSKNQLKFLPEDFGNLVNLKHLDLYNNQLENLPVSFGKLAKLRYLDLKGNPLSPALEKIIGPCLTSKDCQDAARNVVPYYVDLAKKLEKERKRKAELEERQRKLEEEKQREEKRLAKKAARKERVMLERQRKAEEETLFENSETKPSAVGANSNQSIKENNSQLNSSLKILKVVKAFLYLFVLFVLVCAIFLKYFPSNFSAISAYMSSNQRHFFSTIIETIDKSFGNIIQF